MRVNRILEAAANNLETIGTNRTMKRLAKKVGQSKTLSNGSTVTYAKEDDRYVKVVGKWMKVNRKGALNRVFDFLLRPDRYYSEIRTYFKFNGQNVERTVKHYHKNPFDINCGQHHTLLYTKRGEQPQKPIGFFTDMVESNAIPTNRLAKNPSERELTTFSEEFLIDKLGATNLHLGN